MKDAHLSQQPVEVSKQRETEVNPPTREKQNVSLFT